MERVDESRLEHRQDDRLYYLGKPFSGVAFRQSADGQVMYEIGYRDGRRWGPSREWYDDGQLASEEHYAWDWAHGFFRRWHGNDRLAVEENYEWGVALRRRAWDEEGNLIEDYRLEEADPEFRTLQMHRTKFGHLDPITDPSTPPPPGLEDM
jgi:antitoxin component YwqK of YwqJK toxin-antitoxin module